MSYTATRVEWILRNYEDIRNTLEGSGQKLHEPPVPTKPKVRNPDRPVPLGMKPGETWPFMEVPHAREPMDGKAKAQAIQELHIAVIDVDVALDTLFDICQHHPDERTREQACEDYWMIHVYHIYQLMTLAELAAERGVSSPGSMQRRVHRAVQRLAYLMERPK